MHGKSLGVRESITIDHKRREVTNSGQQVSWKVMEGNMILTNASQSHTITHGQTVFDNA